MAKYKLLKESAELFPGAVMVQGGGIYGTKIYRVAEDFQHLLKGVPLHGFFYTANVVEQQPEWFVKIQ